jgi:hypothetical protein
MHSSYFYTEWKEGEREQVTGERERERERESERGRIVAKRVESVIKMTVEETDQIGIK